MIDKTLRTALMVQKKGIIKVIFIWLTLFYEHTAGLFAGSTHQLDIVIAAAAWLVGFFGVFGSRLRYVVLARLFAEERHFGCG